MISLALIVIPFVFALVVAFCNNNTARIIAIIGSLINLLVTIYAFSQFEKTTDYQFAFLADWIPSIGAKFHIGMDGINILLILLTNILSPIIIISTDIKHNKPSLLYGLILFMQCALLGVFLSLDVLLYYLFWELALLPVYLIILLWGSENRYKTVVKFFIYTLAGSLLMLASILYVYLKSPGGNFSIDNFYNNHLSALEQKWVFIGFFAAFAIKIPIIPFHTWQASTYTEAPTSGTMLLAGIMLKMGTYSLLRWLLPITPLALSSMMPYAIGLAVAGIIIGSVIALTQNHFKTLLAYSSLAHVGLISAGIFALNMDGIKGGLLQMFNHGIIVVGLFYIAEIINKRTSTYQLSEMGGIRTHAPQLATYFLLLVLASVALPLTNGFIGEFLLLNAVFQYNMYLSILAGLTIILGAAYMFRLYQKTMLGLDYQYQRIIPDLSITEKIVLIPLTVIIIYIGIFPGYLLDVINPSVEKLLSIIKIVN
jgi:NADH-quinone oxidoreductase subunit M